MRQINASRLSLLARRTAGLIGSILLVAVAGDADATRLAMLGGDLSLADRYRGEGLRFSASCPYQKASP